MEEKIEKLLHFCEDIEIKNISNIIGRCVKKYVSLKLKKINI